MFRLRIQAGPRAGESLSLAPGKTYVVGRAREADFRFPEDATMSRAHAEIAPDAAGGWVLKNKSQHGTLVGALKVDGDRQLAPGDSLTIGGTQVVFEADPAPGSSAPDMATRPPVGAAQLPPGGEPRTPPPMPRPIATPAPTGAAAAAGVPMTMAVNPAGTPPAGTPPAAGATPAGATPAGTPPAGGKPGDPAAAAKAAMKKGGNKGLIVGLVVFVLLLCCCCPGSFYGYRMWRARQGYVAPETEPPK